MNGMHMAVSRLLSLLALLAVLMVTGVAGAAFLPHTAYCACFRGE